MHKLLTIAGLVLIVYSFYTLLKTPDMSLLDKLHQRRKEQIEKEFDNNDSEV